VDPSLNFGFGDEIGSVVEFNFVAVDAAFPNFFVFNADGGDNIFTFTVEADLVVTYQTTLSRKREAETTSVSLKKSLVFMRTSSQALEPEGLAITGITTAGASSVAASSLIIAATAAIASAGFVVLV